MALAPELSKISLLAVPVPPPSAFADEMATALEAPVVATPLMVGRHRAAAAHLAGSTVDGHAACRARGAQPAGDSRASVRAAGGRSALG